MPRLKKVSNASKKNQGEQARAKGKSDARQNPMPRTLERGIGSSYAMAVDNMLEDAKHMRGSDGSFLGQPKESIDAKSFSHSLTSKKK